MLLLIKKYEHKMIWTKLITPIFANILLTRINIPSESKQIVIKLLHSLEKITVDTKSV